MCVRRDAFGSLECQARFGVGTSLVALALTAEDGTQGSHEVYVTREPSSDVSLGSLTVQVRAALQRSAPPLSLLLRNTRDDRVRREA